jgi:hypothetical protein
VIRGFGFKRGLSCLAISFVLGAWPVWGQDSSTTPAAPPDPPKPFQWSAQLDAYAAGDFNDPASGVTALRAFDTHSDAFRLGGSSVQLDYQTGKFGAHLTAGYGDQFAAMAATDPVKGANQYLSQFFVSYRPLKDTGLQFDFGKFYTSIGAEGPDTLANFNYSRSLLFALGEPYYHFGLRATIPVTKTFALSAQLLNGWNTLWDTNIGQTVGFGTVLTQSKWTWSQTMLLCPETLQGTRRERVTANEVLAVTPRPSIDSYFELLYAREKSPDTGADSWYGVAVATRWKTTSKFSVTPRLEYYVDQTGFTTGTPQHIREITATAEYKVHHLVTTRLEFREDFSNRDLFENGKDSHRMQQGTVTLAVLVALKGER